MPNKKAPTKKASAKKATKKSPKKSAKKAAKSPKKSGVPRLRLPAAGHLLRELKPLRPLTQVLVVDALALDTPVGARDATLSQPVSGLFVLSTQHHLFTIGGGQPTTLGISSSVVPDVGADPLPVTAAVTKKTVGGKDQFMLVIS